MGTNEILMRVHVTTVAVKKTRAITYSESTFVALVNL